jgi:hypothetical protein
VVLLLLLLLLLPTWRRYALTCCSWFAKGFPAAVLDLNTEPPTLTNPQPLPPASCCCCSSCRYALTCCSWFAKDFPRLLAAKAAHNWEPYDVEELRGKTLGVVGYGDIGQACARLARAFKMDVVALRRNTTLTAAEQAEGVVVSAGTSSAECLPSFVVGGSLDRAGDGGLPWVGCESIHPVLVQ